MTPDDPRHQHPDDPGQGTPASRDDLASALLDGLLTGDEAAAARRRPDVVARAAEMDAARSAVRAVPSPDPAARDRAVAAALAAFDDEATPAGAGAPPASTGSPSGAQDAAADLDARRRAHRARGRGAPRWLGAAAAVAAVLVGVAGLVAVSSDGGSDDEASQSSASSDEGTSSGDAGAESEESPGESTEAPLADAEAGSGAGTDAGRSASYEAGDLGAFPSEQALLDRIDSMLAPAADDGAPVAPNTTSLPPTEDLERQLGALCPEGTPPPLDDPASAVRLHGRALVDGRDVEVWVVDTVDGRRVLALDTACAVVVDRPLG